MSQICLCQLPALRRIYELDPDSHLARARGEHSRPRFISVRGAVWGTTSRRWRNLARASDVAINHGGVPDVVCHIWSSVIYPNHHRGGAPNLSADTLVKFSSLEKSSGLTVESTLNPEIGANDINSHCNYLLLRGQNCPPSHFGCLKLRRLHRISLGPLSPPPGRLLI